MLFYGPMNYSKQVNIIIRQFWLALSFLTRIPVPKFVHLEGAQFAESAWAFPLVGGLVGGVTTSVYLSMAWLGMVHGIAAWVAIAVEFLLTGGLHEDGLADTADGLACGRNREEKLSIMRDSRVGTYGVLALMVVLTLRTKCMAQFGYDAWWYFISLSACSRACMVALMYSLPNARADGLAANAGKPGKYVTLIAILLGVAPFLMIGLWRPMAACLIVAIATYFIMSFIIKKHFGGITGDVLGAMQQISETAMYVILVLPLAYS